MKSSKIDAGSIHTPVPGRLSGSARTSCWPTVHNRFKGRSRGLSWLATGVLEKASDWKSSTFGRVVSGRRAHRLMQSKGQMIENEIFEKSVFLLEDPHC